MMVDEGYCVLQWDWLSSSCLACVLLPEHLTVLSRTVLTVAKPVALQVENFITERRKNDLVALARCPCQPGGYTNTRYRTIIKRSRSVSPQLHGGV